MTNPQKPKFYSLCEILSRHFTINMICGTRNAGKSTAVQKYSTKRAIYHFQCELNKRDTIGEAIKHVKSNKKQGGEFAVLVRYARDKKSLCETYFNNTMEQFYPDYDMIYTRQKFYLVNKKTNESCLVGYAFALNEATKKKSTSYPHVKTIILEEFLNIEGKYIKNQSNPNLEPELFISLYSTIARGNGKKIRDDVKCFLVSNCYSVDNPYFNYWGFVNKIVENPFKKFYISKSRPKAILEITHNDLLLDIAKGDQHAGTNFQDLKNEIQIIKNPKIKKPILQLTLDNNSFLTVANYNDNNIIINEKQKQHKDCYIFSCSDIKKADIFNIKTFKKMDMYKTLLESYNNNWLYYDSLETYIILTNILNF